MRSPLIAAALGLFLLADVAQAHTLVASQSRRGNCHDNAVAESFFQLLKRERIRRRIYANREQARRDVRLGYFSPIAKRLDTVMMRIDF